MTIADVTDSSANRAQFIRAHFQPILPGILSAHLTSSIYFALEVVLY